MKPDLILHSGKVYTVDANLPWAEAVAIYGRVIGQVGSDCEILDLAGPETQLIDLQRRLVLPGLCDAHIHFYDWSMSMRQVPLAGCMSKDDMLDRIGRWLKHEGSGDEWLISRGWNEVLWDDSTLPTKDDLDAVTGERPALVWRSDMHCAVANSAALILAGITATKPDPQGGAIGRDKDGRPNGLLYELAINQVLEVAPDPEPRELEAAFSEAMEVLHRLGITAIHDQRMKDHREGPPVLGAFQRLNRAGRLKLRVNCNIAAHDLPHLVALGLRSGFGDQYLQLGQVKLFTDGSMGSRTAWMLEPYDETRSAGCDKFGINVTPPEQMAAEIRQAVTAGFPVSIHAIGDQANRVVLDILEEVTRSGEALPVPHRIEHVQIIDPADLPRLAAGRITASVQPIHAIDDMEMAEEVLGPRASRTYNFHSLADSGALLALGSDAPVADPNPFLGFHAAIYRQRPESMAKGAWYGEERLTLEETIAGYTLNAAKAAGREKSIGSITAGKRADLVVLDRDLFELVDQEVSGEEIAGTKVLMTLFDGQIVYQ